METLIASRYAQALFDIAKEVDEVTTFKESLLHIEMIVNENSELKIVLTHPEIPKSDRCAIMERMLKDDTHLYVVNFMKLLIEKNRFYGLSDICSVYVDLYNEYYNIEVVYVYSAKPLSEEEKVDIHTLLEQKTKKNVECKYEIDKQLIAGIRIQIKDEVIENSIANQLLRMQRRVSKAIV